MWLLIKWCWWERWDLNRNLNDNEDDYDDDDFDDDDDKNGGNDDNDDDDDEYAQVMLAG